MDKYTIYCTEEQTKKALKLGAPILMTPEEFIEELPHFNMMIEGENASIILPTTEQMFGWLGEQGIIDYYIDRDIDEEINYLDTYGYFVDFGKKHRLVGSGISTRKEAILYAIDAALEYLENAKFGEW